MYPFKLARFVNSTGKKGPYITFYVWHVQEGKKVQRKKYIPAIYKTKEEIKSYAKDRIKQINKLLKEGYHIDLKREQKLLEGRSKKSKFKHVTFENAIKSYEKLKTARKNYKRGIRTNINSVKLFQKWAEEKYGRTIYVDEVDRLLIQDYEMHILTELGNDGKTFNNKTEYLRNFFKVAKENNWYKGKNPLDKTVSQKKGYGSKNIPYTQEQIDKMKPFILENDPYLWNIICFIYYAFMRVSEIKKLRIRDIDLEENIIWVHDDTAKSKTRDSIPIAPGLRKIIDNMNLDKYDPSMHVIGSYKKPSDIMMGENYVTKHFLKVKQKFGLDKNSDYTVYGFKHTGAVRLYKKTKDIILLRNMCRHSNVSTTEIYLKSLGLLHNEQGIRELPDI